MILEKLVRLVDVQVCLLNKKHVLFFRRLECGLWEQAKPLDNKLAYAIPDDRPLVYNIDKWLDSDDLTINLKRLKLGIFSPK